jgi:hypothetical protein
MKRVFTTCLILCCIALGATSAQAAVSTSKTANVKFYEFDPTFVEGIINRPAFMNFNARGNVRFGRLSNLRRSFIPDLLASTPSRS